MPDAADATVTADAVTVIPTPWDRPPTVTHTDMTADGVTAHTVIVGGLTLHRQMRHVRHHIACDADAALRGVRHLFARHRHTEEAH